MECLGSAKGVLRECLGSAERLLSQCLGSAQSGSANLQVSCIQVSFSAFRCFRPLSSTHDTGGTSASPVSLRSHSGIRPEWCRVLCGAGGPAACRWRHLRASAVRGPGAALGPTARAHQQLDVRLGGRSDVRRARRDHWPVRSQSTASCRTWTIFCGVAVAQTDTSEIAWSGIQRR